MIKPLENLLSDNSLQTFKISLVVLDSIISDDHELSKTLDTFFKNTVGNLNIKNGWSGGKKH